MCPAYTLCGYLEVPLDVRGNSHEEPVTVTEVCCDGCDSFEGSSVHLGSKEGVVGAVPT